VTTLWLTGTCDLWIETLARAGRGRQPGKRHRRFHARPRRRAQRTRRAIASSPMARSVQIREDTDAFTSALDRPGGSLGTGLFSVYVDDSDQPGLEAGPASVPVDDAIAWGRANASTVVVLVCDDAGGGAYFSAGNRTASARPARL
jgi:hypothetical protein